MKNKKGIEWGFNWIFAIIIGIFILFLSVYISFKLFDRGNEFTQTESALKLISLLDPAETGIASLKYQKINFKKETRTYYRCEDIGFGENLIGFSEKTFNQFNKGNDVSSLDKYIFAENMLEGDLFIFSKQFYMPFKIADLVFITNKTYCLIGAPNNIEEDIEVIDNFYSDNCEGEKVCFGNSCNSNIKVIGYDPEYKSGYVDKNGERLYFVDNLIYGAIVSSPENYECNVKRLMNKLIFLIEIYKEKIKIIKCGENLLSELNLIETKASSFKLENINEIYDIANSINLKNKYSICGVY